MTQDIEPKPLGYKPFNDALRQSFAAHKLKPLPYVPEWLFSGLNMPQESAYSRIVNESLRHRDRLASQEAGIPVVESTGTALPLRPRTPRT